MLIQFIKYHLLNEQNLDEIALKTLGFQADPPNLNDWKKIIKNKKVVLKL